MAPYVFLAQAAYLQLMKLRSLIFSFWEFYGGLVQFLSLVFSVILFFGAIFLIIRTRFINYQIERFIDILGAGDLSRRRSVRAWRQIQKRLRLGGEANLKLALIEADKVLDELLKLSGYRGETMDERLKQVTTAQLSNIDDLRQVHKISEQLVREPDYSLKQNEAELAVDIYKKAFQELGLID